MWINIQKKLTKFLTKFTVFVNIVFLLNTQNMVFEN